LIGGTPGEIEFELFVPEFQLSRFTEEVVALAEALIQEGALPGRQLATPSIFHWLLYMRSIISHWNYRHIDNAENKPLIRRPCLSKGYGYPEFVHLKT